MKFYHATTKDNAIAIMADGVIKRGLGGVFFCKDPHDACKFLLLRGVRDIAVITVDLKEDEVEESFDHSEAFFQCKAYTHYDDIKLNGTEDFTLYHFDL